MNHGTHILHLGITARGITQISEFQFFDWIYAYDPIDVVMNKPPAKLEML